MARIVCPARDVDADDASDIANVLAFDPSEVVIPIIPKSTFSFRGRSSTTQYVDLAVGVDVSRFRRVQTILRLHARGTWSSTASASFDLEPVELDPLTPGLAFVGTGTGTGPKITSSVTAPWLRIVQTNVVSSPTVRLRLYMVQETGDATFDHTFTVSVDLLGKLR